MKNTKEKKEFPCCGNCSHATEVKENKDMRKCTRFPPVVVTARNGTFYKFPLVNVEAFCGEYK